MGEVDMARMEGDESFIGKEEFYEYYITNILANAASLVLTHNN